MYDDHDKTKHYWHIDQEYLISIWTRMDSYNKGLEKAVTMKTSNSLMIYRSCWVLLKNVYIDFSPFFFKEQKNKKNEKGVKDLYEFHMTKLNELKKWFYSNQPQDNSKNAEWDKKVNEAVDDMDECKKVLIFAMAEQGSLLGTKFEPGMKSRIKGVMADW